MPGSYNQVLHRIWGEGRKRSCFASLLQKQKCCRHEALNGFSACCFASNAIGKADYYDTTVQRYADMPKDRLTMTRLLTAGTNMNPEKFIVMSQHVQRELAIRLARRLLDMQTLPYIVVANPHIQQVYVLYEKAFRQMISSPKIVNLKLEAEFRVLLDQLVQENVQVVQLLARGMHEARRKVPRITQSSSLNPNQFLADMIMSRISRRVIAEQYIALHNPRPHHVGIICTELSPVEVLRRVIPEAKLVCEHTYGVSPDVEIEGDLSITSSYITTHLEYIAFEVLKNAMRAVVECHLPPDRRLNHTHTHHHHGLLDGSTLRGQRSQGNDGRAGGGDVMDQKQALPPIKVLLSRGPSDISLRFSDQAQGGGVPRQYMDKIFDFGFSTVRDGGVGGGEGGEGDGIGDEIQVGGGTFMDPAAFMTSPLAGLGFGLPTSRLYAQYFGGNVTVSSMEGRGCDVYVRVDHVGDVREFDEYTGFDAWRKVRNF